MTSPLSPSSAIGSRRHRAALGRAVLAGLLGAAGILGGCTDGIELSGGPGGPRHISDDASVDGSMCAALEEGCACEPGTEPVDCYLDPVVHDDGSVMCQHGTRYCRDSTWSGCEVLTSFELPGGSGALLTGPTICNPCDPRCFGYTDRPGPGDLGGSTDVEYDPIRGGITLEPGMPVMPPLTDTDGDGVPDVADACVGPGATLAADGSCYGDRFIYHLLPFGGTAADSLDISIQIRTADVYFLVDGTGSMGGEIARLRTDLTTGYFHPTDATCDGGVTGAIRCAIPDAWFGVGFFEEYPVNPYGGYRSDIGRNNLVYFNSLDITASLGAAQTAINTLAATYNLDRPESNAQALWAVASGGALGPYLSARSGCAAGTWGYPCFRDGTIPVIIHITDAPYHNGPSGAYPYAFSWGSGATNVTGNEDFIYAHPHGPVSAWAFYSGTTSGMVDDSAGGCGTSGARDAVYSFTVPAGPDQTVTIRTEGSSFDTSIALYRHDVMGPTAVSGNETPSTAYDIAAPASTAYAFTGDTAGMADDIGSGFCGSSGAPDALYRFDLTAATTVSIDTVGSAYDTVLSLWQPAAPIAVTGNEAITTSPTDVGTITAATSLSYSGNTAAMAHDHSAAACGSVVAPDAAFRFALSGTETITLDTIGSSYDTVLSVYARSSTAVSANDLFAEAYDASAALGTNRTYTGSTSGMNDDVTSACGGDGADALYVMTFAGTATLDVDTIGSSFDTVLTLYQYAPLAPAVAVTGNDTQATAYDLGTLGAGYHAQFTGDTSAMAHDHSSACRNTTAPLGRDVFYTFTLAATRRVTLDLSGSPFNTTVALLDAGGTEMTCDNNAGAGDDGLLTLTLAAGTYYAVVDGRQTSHFGNYTLRVAADELTEVACDDDGGGGTDSSLVQTISSGTYLLAVDGWGAFDEGNYVLNFGAGGYTQIACDNDGIAAGGASRMTQTLGAGEYFAVVDGFGSASGSYRLNFGAGAGLSNITCNDDAAGLGTASQIVQALPAGTYYIGVDGWAASSGAYTLNFSGSSAATLISCNDDGPVAPASELVATLAPGAYYIVVDGAGAASGNYQLAFGTTPTTVAFPGPVTWSDTIAALTARDVRVITLQTCGDWADAYCLEGESHATTLANATGSVDGTGTPYVFRGNSDGSGLSSAIVNAVVNLANYSRMDITARVVGDTNGFTQLPITATSWGPSGSCTGISGGTTFLGCLPGTDVNFNVQFLNTTVMATMVAQVFQFYIEIVGDGSIVLERVPVLIVVPPMVATYPASGSYVRDYDSTVRCALNERPIWRDLGWDVPDLPAGTSIQILLSTADTAAGLPTAMPVATYTVPAPGTGSFDITTALTGAGALPRLYHLRVNAVLNSSPDRFRAPVLRQIDVSYNCIPDE